MDRKHNVYTFFIAFSAPLLVPDPLHPNSGEMQRSGEMITHVKTLTVIATSQAIAEAAIKENPHRYPNLILKSCIQTKIDAIIETHTY